MRNYRTIEVQLIGANGSRTTQVTASGLTSRHVQAPRENANLIPSIFGNASHVSLSDTTPDTPEPVIEPTTPVETPQKPIGDRMTDLIAEVNAKLARRHPADTRLERAVDFINRKDCEHKARELHLTRLRREECRNRDTQLFESMKEI